MILEEKRDAWIEAVIAAMTADAIAANRLIALLAETKSTAAAAPAMAAEELRRIVKGFSLRAKVIVERLAEAEAELQRIDEIVTAALEADGAN